MFFLGQYGISLAPKCLFLGAISAAMIGVWWMMSPTLRRNTNDSSLNLIWPTKAISARWGYSGFDDFAKQTGKLIPFMYSGTSYV